MNELISVIIPVYKVENYIHRCVDSVLRQTYNKIEIILVDDGSTDRCGEICDEYAALDNRVKVIHKKNGGLSDARNAGIEIFQGDYITFLDSDDWIHDKYIEKLYRLLKNSNSDIAVGNFIRTSAENIQVDIAKEEIYEYSNFEALEQFTDKFYAQMVIACGKLYKRNLFDEIRFPVGRIHEDEFTTYKLIYKANKIILTTAQLLYYWQREDSIMGSSLNLNQRMHAIDAYKERAEFFKDIGMEELSSKTYRILFNIYMTAIRRIYEFDNINYKESFSRDFKDIRKTLRKSKQTFKFKAFYELYFVAPKIMCLIYKVYCRLKRN